ncbi:MAG: hypothetical protein IPK85_03440 [Gemmatimonadetes bacterium]|nr:hypothetical protein [Gemmatimonadota bacterium]
MAKISRSRFSEAVIAQDDDCDYQESGWVACIIDGRAYLARYSHCSCYGTESALAGGGVNDSGGAMLTMDWEGTPGELLDMARRKADPNMPDRTSIEADHDHDHLMKVYEQVIAQLA